MNDLYNKPDKAGHVQQIKSRIALLQDQYHELEAEKLDILGDIIKLELSLKKLTKENPL